MSGYYWHFQDQHLSITFFIFCLRNNNLASPASHFADPISTSEHQLLCILLIQDQHLSITCFQPCFTLPIYQSSAKFLISLTICICLAALIRDSKPSYPFTAINEQSTNTPSIHAIQQFCCH